MIGANRQVDKDWSEFESYATNLYARTVISDQPLSSSALIPSTTSKESSQITSDIQVYPSNFDIKSINDEMSSIKRSIGELRTYAEEV
jgi:hypothetical protein